MNRLIDPLALRLFVAVCETGSIAAAADREALVPSAVSKRIAAIEARLGVALLVRRRRGVTPTEAGLALLRQSREVLDAMDRLHAEVEGFGAGVAGSVRIAASVSALAERLPDDVAEFLTRFPDVRVSLDERDSTAVVREVRAGSADLGVAWDAVDTAGLTTHPWRTDHLHVVMPPDHPLATRPRLRFVDTLDHPSVGAATAGLVAALFRRQAALIGRSITHRMQVSSLDACLRIVAAGLGLAILPAEAVSAQVAVSRLVLRPLHEPWATRRFVIVTREAATASVAARELVAHLASAAAELRASAPSPRSFGGPPAQDARRGRRRA